MRKNTSYRKLFFWNLILLALFFFLGRAMDTDVHLDDIFLPFSKRHWLGTDDLGRDVFALLVVGGFRTFEVIFIAGFLSFGSGVFLGMFSGYFGKSWSLFLKSFVDLLMIIPTFICAIIITSIFGINPITAGISLGIFGVGNYMNHAEALTKREKEKEYVLASKLLGVPWYVILFRNIFVNILEELKVNFGNTVGGVLLQYASLTFIGLGSDVTKPDWGAMLYHYRMYFISHSSLILLPSLCIIWVSLSIHLCFDSKKKGER